MSAITLEYVKSTNKRRLDLFEIFFQQPLPKEVWEDVKELYEYSTYEEYLKYYEKKIEKIKDEWKGVVN